MAIMETIQIKIKAFAEGISNIDRFNEKMATTGMKAKTFGDVMRMNMPTFKKFNETQQKGLGVGAKMGVGFRMLTHGARGFRMELLSTMFFGMMLTRVFKGMMGPAMEVYGVTQLMSSALMVMFLPAMEMIFPLILSFTEWMTNLPESSQKAIGVFVILVGIFGVILGALGAVGLGIGGLVVLWATLSAAAVAVGVSVGGLILIILGIIAAFALVLLNIDLFVTQFTNMWDGLKQTVAGVIIFFKGIFGFFFHLLTGQWSKLGEDIKNVWEGIKNTIMGIWNIIKAPFEAMFNMGSRAIKFIGGKIFGGYQFGGTVPRTGPYMLHKGETVTPSEGGGGMTFSPNVTINANVSSDMDVRILGSRLNEIWADELKSKMIR